MKAPAAVIAELMVRVRRDLFKGKPDKTWFAQQALVKKALTYPAHWLEERKVPLSAARYQAILNGILDTMLAKGNLDGVYYLSRYLLTVVQRHMDHHGDEYYQEGKSCRNRLALDLAQIEAAHAAKRDLPDQTINVLDQVHHTINLGKRNKKPVATPMQPGLF